MTIPVVRVRTKTPKVRTGCRTCKARRVRCDETKPTCERCAKAGRECAGYEANVTPPLGRPDTRILKASIYPSPESITSPMPCLSALPTLVDGLHGQALQYFTTRVAPQLSGHFSADLYSRLLLQVSYQQEAVLHACLAVSFMHRAHATRRLAQHEESCSLSAQDFHERQALHSYTLAVSSLRNLINDSNHSIETSKIEIVLLVCLLCVHFSLLRGSEEEAFTHLSKGLAVIFGLSRPYAPTRGDRFRPLIISTMPTTAMEILLQEFIRLDHEFASYSTREPYLSPALHGSDFEPAAADLIYFTTYAEAKNILDVLASSVARHHGALLRYTTNHVDEVLGLKSKDEAHRDAYIRAFSRGIKHGALTNARRRTGRALAAWSSALEALASGQSHDAAYMKLRLQFFTVWFLHSTFNDPHEMVTDIFETTFEQVVEIAEKYLGNYSTTGGDAASFDASPAAIPALFAIGMKCRTPSIRRKAITLLHSTTLQEGLWHGPPLAVLAAQVTEVEERRAKGLASPLLCEDQEMCRRKCTDVPEAARYSDVVFMMDDVVQQRARLVCARTENAVGAGGCGGRVVVEEFHLLPSCTGGMELLDS